jgi:hypothetical protein
VGFYIMGPDATGRQVVLGEWEYAALHGLGRDGATVVVTRADSSYVTPAAIELATTSEVDAVELAAMLRLAMSGKIVDLRQD